MAMERIFSGYIKAHGYAIAVAALTFGCIFAVEVAHVDNFHQISRTLDDDDGDGSSGDDWISGGHQHQQHHAETYFRMRPLGQLVFSLVWVLAGTIFLVGLLFEKKKTILPFATVFAIDWSVILIQHLTKLERRSFLELVLSTDTAVLVVILVYVGFTLAVLYRLFEQRAKERAQMDEDDMENGRKPVKFTLGEEFDDSWIS
ncbi:uncharacterized protein LOC135702735 [Ochlerotatus camptorhynchus]|uniref:uncharacterized protein LOC135702735 n=1 Tax=Ochlerotatus camptorhynchus TaxID=644619 RepID=UPI0031DBE1FD